MTAKGVAIASVVFIVLALLGSLAGLQNGFTFSAICLSLSIALASFASGAVMGFLAGYTNFENPEIRGVARSLAASIAGASLSAVAFKGKEFITWAAENTHMQEIALLAILITFGAYGFFAMYFTRTLWINPRMAIASRDVKRILSDAGATILLSHESDSEVPPDVKNAALRVVEQLPPEGVATYEDLFSRGIALKYQGRIAEALQHFAVARDMRPNDYRIYAALAATLFSLKKIDAAKESIAVGMRKLPGDGPPLWLKEYARILSELGMQEDSARYYAQYLRIHPTDSQAHFDHARVLAAQMSDSGHDPTLLARIQSELCEAIRLDSSLREQLCRESGPGGPFAYVNVTEELDIVDNDA